MLLLTGCQKAALNPVDDNVFVDEQPKNQIVIAIDPGHGFDDIGAEGYINEIELIEKTSQYLYDLLLNDVNFKPILTRELPSYELVDRVSRSKIANKENASLFISIHGNSDETDRSNGFEIFAAPPGRNNHDESLKFAKLVAENMGSIGYRLRGETGVRYKYYILNKKKNTYSSEIQEESYNVITRSEYTLGVIENSNCPTVLIEQCFVNNKDDFEKFCNDGAYKNAANMYYQSILAYFNFS